MFVHTLVLMPTVMTVQNMLSSHKTFKIKIQTYSVSKMTSMYFLWRIMGTFDSNQMWLLGTYLLSTKNTRSRIVTPQEDHRTLQVWIHVEMSLTSESRPN